MGYQHYGLRPPKKPLPRGTEGTGEMKNSAQYVEMIKALYSELRSGATEIYREIQKPDTPGDFPVNLLSRTLLRGVVAIFVLNIIWRIFLLVKIFGK